MVILFDTLLNGFRHYIFLDGLIIGEVYDVQDYCVEKNIADDKCNLSIVSEQYTNELNNKNAIQNLLGYMISNNPFNDIDIYNYQLSFEISNIENDKSAVKISFSDINKIHFSDMSAYDVSVEKCNISNVKENHCINEEVTKKHLQNLKNAQKLYLFLALCITVLFLTLGIFKHSFVLISLCILFGVLCFVFYLIGRRNYKKICKQFRELVLK